MNEYIAQECSEEIEKLKEKELYQKKEIERLRNDNSTKQEQIDRHSERLLALEREIKERKAIYDEIEKKYGKEPKKNDEKPGTKKKENEYRSQPTLDSEEGNLKIIEKLNVVIDNFKHRFEIKSVNYKETLEVVNPNEIKDELEHLINSKIIFNFVTIKLLVDSSQKLWQGFKDSPYQANVRFGKKTTFAELRKFICQFWKLKGDDFTDFEIMDENHNQIMDNDNVEKFFLQKASAAEFNQAMILIKLKNIKQTELNGAQEESIKINKKKKTDVRIKKTNFKKKTNEEINYVDWFFEIFPGLKYYINVDKLKEYTPDEKIVKIERFDDFNCCVILWYLILLGMLATLFSLMGVTNYNYFFSQSLDPPTEYYKALITTQTDMTAVYKMTNISYFLENEIWSNFFSNNNLTETSNIWVGPMQFRIVEILIVRTKSKNCSKQIPNVVQKNCTYLQYNEDTKYTDPIGDGTEDWMRYNTAEQNGISSMVNGYYSDYDGSGYVVNFTQNTKLDVVVEKFKSMGNAFFSVNPRALIIMLTIYNPNIDEWMILKYLVEYSVSGILTYSPPNILLFKLSMYSNPDGQVFRGAFGTMIFILVALFLFLVYQIVFKIKNGETVLGYFVSFMGFLNLAILLTLILIVVNGYGLYYSPFPGSEALVEQKFLDLTDKGAKFQTNFVLISICLIFVINRVVLVFKINMRFSLLLLTLEKAGIDLVVYSIILFPILIGFCFVGMNLWGAQSEDYSTFSNAFVSIILLAVGKADVITLVDIDYYWTLLFLTFFYFVLVFFLISVFLGIFIDSYRLVIMEIGYSFGRQNAWKLSDYIRWFFSWMPKFVLAKFGLKKTKEQDEFVRENDADLNSQNSLGAARSSLRKSLKSPRSPRNQRSIKKKEDL